MPYLNPYTGEPIPYGDAWAHNPTTGDPVPGLYQLPGQVHLCGRCERELTVNTTNFRWMPNPNPERARFHTRCRSCENEQRNLRRGRVPAASPRAVGRAATYNSNFGVELEVICSAGRHALDDTLRAHGCIGWRVTYDGSLSPSGVEVVSPVLRGAYGMEQVRLACLALDDVGATVNRSCGLHVHVDVAGLPARVIKRFVLGYLNNQTVIDGLVSSSRRGNTYCSTWNESERANLRRASDEDAAVDRAGRPVPARNRTRQTIRTLAGCQSGGRYRSINLHSYAAHGTVEIRQHQGTTNFRKVEAWIVFVQRLLEKACHSEVATQANVPALLTDIAVDEDTNDYLVGRALRLAAN